MNIGDRVKLNTAFPNLKKDIEGVVVEDYGTGITIAWDLPNRPYPKDKTPQEVAEMWAVQPDCPLRDGFDKADELRYMEKL